MDFDFVICFASFIGGNIGRIFFECEFNVSDKVFDPTTISSGLNRILKSCDCL